jgi:hypothetical protein
MSSTLDIRKLEFRDAAILKARWISGEAKWLSISKVNDIETKRSFDNEAIYDIEGTGFIQGFINISKQSESK